MSLFVDDTVKIHPTCFSRYLFFNLMVNIDYDPVGSVAFCSHDEIRVTVIESEGTCAGLIIVFYNQRPLCDLIIIIIKGKDGDRIFIVLRDI